MSLEGLRFPLTVRLFDAFRLSRSDAPPGEDPVIALRGRRARGLLAYLLFAPDHTATRERLAGLLWSDRGDAQARSSLRQCLLELKTASQHLGIEVFEAGRDTVRLLPGTFDCDVFEIERALASGDSAALTAHLAALGPAQLLSDLVLPGLFSEWLDQARATLDARLADGVRDGLDRRAEVRDWRGAVALADAWLRREPLDEHAVAAALAAEMVQGAQAAAQRRYRAFKALLAKELGVAPGAAVEAALARVASPEPGVPRAVPQSDAHDKEPAGEAAPAVPGPRVGERRHVAVLVCALRPEGELDPEDDPDPEDWTRAVEAFERTGRAALSSFDCRVITNGATLTALFGAERLFEDDTLRAVRGARAVIAAIAGIELPAGIGTRPAAAVDCGPLVIAQPERPVTGPTLDRAQRLQLSAPPGAVLVSAAAARLVEGFCVLERFDAGAFRVIEGEPALSRLDRSRARGLSRFVGRGEEFALLSAALDQAGGGEGQAIGVMADAGTGKSRLCYEFVGHCRERRVPVHTGAASREARSTPFKPVIDVLRSLLGCDPHESPEATRGRIEARALALDPQLGTALPLLFDLVGLPDPARPAPALDPAARPRQMAGLLRHVLARVAADGAVVVLIEDLHWIDEASLAVMEQLAGACEGTRTLLLCNYRPEFRADFLRTGACRQIALAPLTDSAVATLLEDLLGTDSRLAELAAPITERTRGNPYFIEEIVQTLAETGVIAGARGACRLVGRYDALRIPPTVRAVVSARIDRLPLAARRVLQVAAVIGPRFAEPLLAVVAAQPAAALGDALTLLQRHEFIVEQALFPIAEYVFRHPLTLDVALESLTRASRVEVHAAVGRALEVQEADRLDAVSASVAYHWEHAGEAIVAARWHRRAAEHVAQSDFPTAARHWRKALDLARGRLGDPDDYALVFAACIALLNLNYRTGSGIDAARAVLAEGDALAAAIGNEAVRLTLALCFSRAFCAAGDAEAYHASAVENHARAQDAAMADLQPLATLLLADALVYTGRSEALLALTDDALARWAHNLPRAMWISGSNPHTFFALMRGAALNWLGQLGEARAQYHHAMTLAEADGTPEVAGWTAFLLCQSVWRLADAGATMACAEQVATIAETLGSPLLILYRHIGHGLAWLAAGDPARAIAQSEQAMQMVRHTELHWSGATRLYHALALLDGGRSEDALSQARRAVTECRACGTAQFEAEAWGVLAMALLAAEGVAARADIEAALDEVDAKLAQGIARVLEPERHEWRGALARALGNSAAAEVHYEAARAIHRQRGAQARLDRLALVTAG